MKGLKEISERINAVQNQKGNYEQILLNWLNNRSQSLPQDEDMQAVTLFLKNAFSDIQGLVQVVQSQNKALEQITKGASRVRTKTFAHADLDYAEGLLNNWFENSFAGEIISVTPFHMAPEKKNNFFSFTVLYKERDPLL